MKTFKQTVLALAVVGLVLPAAPIFVSDAEAKGFRSSSSSFSRSSFRSAPKATRPSFKAAKPKPKATQKVASKQKATTNTNKSKFTPVAKKKTFASTPKAGKQQAANTRARFKKQPAVTKTAATSSRTYKSTPVYNRASSYDRGTYYSRRSSYYDTWSAPSYVYYGSPSYGVFDTLFLYHILSTPHAGAMSYNYQNNSDYKAWRAEADKLAVENAELRTQLAAMDASAAKQTGPINAGYVPDGVDADLMLSDEARTSLIPTFNACVAGASGTYAKLMVNTVGPNTSNVRINIVPTSGSREILANIASGKCDGGFVQGDSYWNYIETNQTTKLPFERVMSPYKESVHLVCNTNAATYDGLVDLTKANTVYFPAKSGAEETWTNLVNENADYDTINAVTVNSYEAAINKAAQEKNACALYVGATGSSELMRKTDLGAAATKLELVEVVDSDILKTTDPSGSKVYSAGSISEYSYPNLLRDGGCYSLCSGDVPTLKVNADFIISTQWKAKNASSYDGFVLDLMGMQPAIAKGANR